MDDKQKVNLAKEGELDSFLELIEDRKEKIYRIANSYVKNQHLIAI